MRSALFFAFLINIFNFLFSSSLHFGTQTALYWLREFKTLIIGILCPDNCIVGTFCNILGKRDTMQEAKGHVLVVDDDKEMMDLISDFLLANQYKVISFTKATEAIIYIKDMEEKGIFLDLVISDINMPELTGIDLIRNIHRTQPDLPIILITAFGSVDTAVDAIRAGAFDYVVKPFQLTELGVSIDRAVRFGKIQNDNNALRKEVNKKWTYKNILGKSPEMKQILDLIPRITNAKTNVLITGESGTGKEVIARAIHESGDRANKNFVPINCTAIPENLLESELFGHAKGSFTGAHQSKKGLFEEADGGTLFLDEIGDMDLSLQAKLLRVLQERKIKPVGENQYKEVDVRILAATHKNLKELCKQGKFREDLYYRLTVIPIHLPPLRERKEDIPALAELFLKKYSAINNAKARSFSRASMEKLVDNHWEGNVRELENVVERAVVLCPNEIISENFFSFDRIRPKESNISSSSNTELNFEEDLISLEELEKRYIKKILDHTRGRKEKAARILGINRRTLYRKERLYGFVEED